MAGNKWTKLLSLSLAVLMGVGIIAGCGTKQDTNELVELQATETPTPEKTAAPEIQATEAPAPQETQDDMVLDGDAGDEAVGETMSHHEDYLLSKNLNSDVIGWISVPNTRIEYPVLLTDSNDYYLSRNIKKERSKSGSIFMDYRNAKASQQRHIIIYGHNMNNGSMFNDLNQYKKKDFFENNRIITLYWNDKPLQYEIYAATNVNEDMDFIRVKFNNDEEFLEFANGIKNLSKYTPKPDVEIKADDQILTLITCTYEYDHQRFLVQARRITP